MTEDLCQCPKCGRMHRLLGKPPWRNRAREILTKARAEQRLSLEEIQELLRILDERTAV